MKSSTFNYIIVGAFVMAIIAGLIVSMSFLTGRRGDVSNYYAVYANVTGIKYGTQVMYEGFVVGQVDRVEPFESQGQMKFRVHMEIRDDWRIPDDSEARIEAPNLLSPIVINIHAGQSPTQVAEGDRIPSTEAYNIFSEMSTVALQVQELTADLKPVLQTLNKTLTGFNKLLDEEGKDIAHDVRTVTKTMAEDVPQIVADIKEISGRVRRFAEGAETDKGSLNALLAKADSTMSNIESASGNVKTSLEKIDKLVDKVDGLVANMDGLVADNRGGVGSIVKDLQRSSQSLSRHVDSISRNLDNTSRNLNELSRKLRRNPGAVLGGRSTSDADRRARTNRR